MADYPITFLSRLFDVCDTERRKAQLERAVVWLATLGFVVHLLLIVLARMLPDGTTVFLSQLNKNFLHAAYTPFSFILFHEVLLLVFALPRSHTKSIGIQYEIISLIIIRRVFKDIGEFSDPAKWMLQMDMAWAVLTDMGGALAMFLVVTLFHRVSQTVAPSDPHEELGKFVAMKKAVAMLLLGVLVMLALYNVMQWVLESVPMNGALVGEATGLDYFFFPTFFEFMIFTDIFLLIVSIPFYDRYEYLFRNSGFVISTVLLRFSLSTPKPWDLALGLIAMLYGLGVLGIFSYLTQLHKTSSRTV